jgi:hypothetical protein
MSDAIWIELAECVGHALAERWLARRLSQPADPVTTEMAETPKPLPEDKGVTDETSGQDTSQIGSISK